MRRQPVFRVVLVLAIGTMFVPFISGTAAAQTLVFINELHYDNEGADQDEGVEVAGPAATDLAGWTVALYNGATGEVYDTIILGGTIPNLSNGYGVLHFPRIGIQNGAPDGMALVDHLSTVIQFLSYEGTFVAIGGPANGMTSTDIGVAEDGTTPIGHSLQLIGTGGFYEEFTWNTPTFHTRGAINTNQTFQGGSFALIFRDGFETGNTSRWSVTVP